MRQLEYLSPTSFGKFKADAHQFYREYLADIRPPRWQQTPAMSVGSSFDAHVKNRLVKDLMGRADGRFDLATLFEAQVEAQHRDTALAAGARCMAEYISTGSYADLLRQMVQSPTPPRFEFTSVGIARGVLGGVPLLGKPDATFVDTAGYSVILDWKVNGYYSASAPSPAQGYMMCRPKPGVAHKRFMRSSKHEGMPVNGLMKMEEVDIGWATQTCIYSWLAGYAVGSDFKVAIDQVVGNPGHSPAAPLRVAQHRALVGAEWQHSLLAELIAAWEVITSGWIFRDMSEDNSREMQEIYDRGGAEPGADEDWFTENVRKGGNW